MSLPDVAHRVAAAHRAAGDRPAQLGAPAALEHQLATSLRLTCPLDRSLPGPQLAGDAYAMFAGDAWSA